MFGKNFAKLQCFDFRVAKVYPCYDEVCKYFLEALGGFGFVSDKISVTIKVSRSGIFLHLTDHL